MGGGLFGGGGGLFGLPDPLNLHGNAGKKEQKELDRKNAARKHKLDNPEDDTQETTRVLQL